jgi:predicted HTH domain antitoxin
MPVTLPDDLLQSTKLTEAELKAELALALFQQERLTLGQAAILAGLPQLDFQRLLAGRGIPLHYGIEAMEQDLQRVKGCPELDRRFRHLPNPQPRRCGPALPAS